MLLYFTQSTERLLLTEGEKRCHTLLIEILLSCFIFYFFGLLCHFHKNIKFNVTKTHQDNNPSFGTKIIIIASWNHFFRNTVDPKLINITSFGVKLTFFK